MVAGGPPALSSDPAGEGWLLDRYLERTSVASRVALFSLQARAAAIHAQPAATPKAGIIVFHTRAPPPEVAGDDKALGAVSEQGRGVVGVPRSLQASLASEDPHTKTSTPGQQACTQSAHG